MVDVSSNYSFSCASLNQDEQNSRNLYSKLTEKDIETVIPKSKGDESIVMVLKGEFKGETGKILSRDKKKEEVLLQIGMVNIEKVSMNDCSMIY